MGSELYRLLDNRWQVQIFRNVERRYCAAAKLMGEKWSDLFEMVTIYLTHRDNVETYT